MPVTCEIIACQLIDEGSNLCSYKLSYHHLWHAAVQLFTLHVVTIAARTILSGRWRICILVMMTKSSLQVFLAQGLANSIAIGLTYVPTLAIVSHYFRRRRAFVLGISAAVSKFEPRHWLSTSAFKGICCRGRDTSNHA